MEKTNPSLFFLEGEALGAPGLKGSHCPECQQIVLLEVAACPKCGYRELDTVCIGQKATLGQSSEVLHSTEGFEAPYFIGQIETAEGPHTFAPLDVKPGTQLSVGMPLTFKLHHRADGRVGFIYAVGLE